MAFGSVELEPNLRHRLLAPLEEAHATEPFSPGDARAAARRASDVVGSLGLTVVTIRGSLAVSGVEVDHVWLAVTDGAGGPWVLDPAFPLHHRDFVALLAGYVAGDITAAELAQAAMGTALEQRVLGSFPRGAGYRGEPVWAGGVR